MKNIAKLKKIRTKIQNVKNIKMRENNKRKKQTLKGSGSVWLNRF